MTKRQRQILDFIERFVATNGYSPALHEIASAMGLKAVSTVHKHLQNLERQGVLKRHWNQGRGLELTQTADDKIIQVRVMGRVAAGKPFKPVHEVTEISLPASIASSSGTYVLRVEGDSMVNDQISDGDYIIVEKTDTANNGDTIVAKLLPGEELTVKKYFREDGKVRLQPANETHAAEIYNENEVQVAGLVVGLLRKYK